MNFVKKLAIHMSLLGTLLFSQNCTEGFKVDSSQNIDSLNSVNSAVCTSGATESGYLMSTALQPQLCGSLITKTCINGQWDRSEQLVPTCQQLCRHPVTNEAAAVGITFISYSVAQAATQELCNAARVQSTCNQVSGLFTPAPGLHSACLVQGQVCAYANGPGLSVPSGNMTGATVAGYTVQSATSPTLCGAQVTRTCQATGLWSGTTPLYTTCEQRCLHPDSSQPVTQNTVYTYFTRASGSQAECNAARVTSTCQAGSGLFAPVVAATRFQSCTVVATPPPPGNSTAVVPAAQLEFIDASGVRQNVSVVDGQTQITGTAPFLVQIDASGTRAPVAFAAQTLNTDADAYSFLMVGYRLHFGENLSGFWRYPETLAYSKNEETGPPLFSRVYTTVGTHNARLKVRDVLGNESVLRFTVNVTAPPAATNIPVSAGSWPTFQSGRRYTLQAGADYRSFGTLELGGLHNVIIEKVGTGADPRIANFSPDGRSKFNATQRFEARGSHLRLINIDIQHFTEGQRGFDYVAVIGGLVRQFSFGIQNFAWAEGSEIVRTNCRYSRGLFFQDTELHSTAAGSGYVMFGTYHGFHARGTQFVHRENGPTTYSMLRLYGRMFSLRFNNWRLDVDGNGANGIMNGFFALGGATQTTWRDDDMAGPLSATSYDQHYGFVGDKMFLQNNQFYGQNSFLTNAHNTLGGGNPTATNLVRPRLVGAEDNVFFPSGNVARSIQNAEIAGQHNFWRNNRKNMGLGEFVTATSGAPNRGVGDSVTFHGPYHFSDQNPRPVPTGF